VSDNSNTISHSHATRTVGAAEHLGPHRRGGVECVRALHTYTATDRVSRSQSFTTHSNHTHTHTRSHTSATGSYAAIQKSMPLLTEGIVVNCVAPRLSVPSKMPAVSVRE